TTAPLNILLSPSFSVASVITITSAPQAIASSFNHGLLKSIDEHTRYFLN
ncbi:unnamed protein product, partial [Rotaria sordida]